MTAMESAVGRRAFCHREKALGRVAGTRPFAPKLLKVITEPAKVLRVKGGQQKESQMSPRSSGGRPRLGGGNLEE
jgi:hypothetical protein